jgi:hypothetical protein
MLAHIRHVDRSAVRAHPETVGSGIAGIELAQRLAGGQLVQRTCGSKNILSTVGAQQ